MDPIIVGIILLFIWVVASECDLFVGILFFVCYGVWFPDEEPKKPETPFQVEVVEEVIQETPKFNKDSLMTNKESCENQGGIWTIDECIK